MKTTTIPTKLLAELLEASWCACYLMSLDEPRDMVGRHRRTKHNHNCNEQLELILRRVTKLVGYDTLNANPTEDTNEHQIPEAFSTAHEVFAYLNRNDNAINLDDSPDDDDLYGWFIYGMAAMRSIILDSQETP